MKKHQVNHSPQLPKRWQLRRRPKLSRAAAVGTAVLATLALSVSPVLEGRQVDASPLGLGAIDAQAASFAQPVEVSLLSGVDAIRWESENITSAAAGAQVADASDPGAVIGVAGATAQLVGQNVGPLGVLPAGIRMMHPVSSRHITSPYGWRSNPTGAGTQIHIGQDYAIGCGSPVYASSSGTVVQSAWAGHSGMRVTIDHGSSVRTGYSHNSKLIAAVGQHVEQGQLIALSGTTGNSTGCHVHFEIIINGRWNDPRNFLPAIPGQPNPMIDSRRTTIAADPIRNGAAPKSENSNGHDIDAKLPDPPKAQPPSKTPEQNQGSPTPGENNKPKPKPKPDPSESEKPGTTPPGTTTPLPTDTGKPDPSPTDSGPAAPTTVPPKETEPKPEKPTSSAPGSESSKGGGGQTETTPAPGPKPSKSGGSQTETTQGSPSGATTESFTTKSS